MDFWNPGGNPATMCGNGLRCVTRFAVENKLVEPGDFKVTTGVGDLKVEWDGKSEDITVQIGRANFDSRSIPLFGLDFYRVDMGNPHAVAFVDDYENAPVQIVGPKVEVDSNFPDGRM